MFKLWTEWDFGLDDLIFESREEAIRFVKDVVLSDDEIGPDFKSFEELEQAGLAGISPLTIWGKE